jgi:pimeloyl-ACP methyl ester carboxylesterase
MELLRDSIATREGEIWLWRRADASSAGKPAVLWIDGAFSIPRPRSFELQDHLPEATVFNAHLPGNHSPPLRAPGVEVYAAAFSEVLDRIGMPTIVVGASVGGLVAFAMRSPWLRGIVALEPPLLTAKLWPLIGHFQKMLRDRPDDAELRAFIGAVFGYGPRDAEGRDYRPLLSGLEVPTWVLCGGEPLYPERAAAELPSLVDQPERDLLAAHPQIRTRLVPGIGHNVGGRAITYVRTCVHDLIVRTIGADEIQTEVN